MTKGKELRLIVSMLVVAVFGLYSSAMPAKRGLRTVKMPDGSTIEVQLKGDEHCHIYLTEDGYPLVSDNKFFYYATPSESGDRLVSTGVKARPASLRDASDRAVLEGVERDGLPEVFRRMSAKKTPTANGMKRAQANLGDNNRFLFRTFPNQGQQKALIILVEYPDVPFTLDDPLDYFTRMLNEKGFSTRGATGSANDFFRESSNGLFDPQFDVYGPVMLQHERVYYGGGSNEENAWQMVIEACDQLDDVIDFTEYDRDGDGQVDNIYIFFAGEGESSSGIAETVWPHAAKIMEIDLLHTHIYDGKIINSYGVSNEWENGNPDGVGTFCHEFSHVMGLPDLYATEYTDAFDPGEWSALAYGPYNNEGRTPPLYSAFERYCVGWLKLEELPETGNITIPPVGTNKAYAIKTSNPDEFYVLENRQQLSWDTYIPYHGMLVWHIDYDQSVWSRNAVNNSTTHQRIDIVEADNTRTAESRTGDVFPGTAGVTSFTDDTTPSMMTWQNYRLSRPITEITETEDGFITFKVSGGYGELSAPAAFATSDTPGSHSVNLQWQAVEGADDYLVSVYREGTFLPIGKADMSTAGATTLAVTGLDAAQAYCCYVQAVSGKIVSAPSALLTFITAEPGFDDIVPVAHEATSITGSGFTASWDAVSDADGYLLNVYTKGDGDPIEFTVDFTDGVDKLPEGWTTTSKLSYSLSGYVGASAPSLRLSADGDKLQSCEFGDGIRSIRLWHRGNGSKTTSNFIVINGLYGDEWKQLVRLPVCKDAGGRTDSYDDIAQGCTALQIVYEANESGSLALDDIVIGYGAQQTRIYTEGFEGKAAGVATSVAVEGLRPSTDYYYTVVATREGLRTLESNEVAVTTAAESALESVAVEQFTVAVADGVITVAGVEAGCVCVLADMSGRVMARNSADSFGTAVMAAPSAGVYVLRIGDKACKVIVK